jgi:3-dehydroquinate dehydratase-2
MARILLINGPNLNLLGRREPEFYGATPLSEIEARLQKLAAEMGHELASMQSNHEGALIDAVQRARDQGVEFILINPGGYTHSSVALRDALLGVGIPFIEIHVSNVAAREPFRRRSFLADVAAGSIVGLGPIGYELALRAAAERLSASGSGKGSTRGRH